MEQGGQDMLGAIAGDIIGSVHELAGTKSREFDLFTPESHYTDDTILTVAVADGLLHGRDYVDLFHDYFARDMLAGFGMKFIRWAGRRSRDPYMSHGNGSAMRVSPVALAFDTMEEVLAGARRSAEVTHNHPEGIRGAQATAAAGFLARTGADKPAIKSFIESEFGYDLSARLDNLREGYAFDVSCAGSVPPSIIAFLESDDYEGAVRNAISLGGDADTMACIAGGIAEAFHAGIPQSIADEALGRLTRPLRAVVEEFYARFGDRLRRRG